MIKKPNGNQILSEEKRNGMKKELEVVFTDMIKILQFDPEHPQLKDTPKRMARMYVDELFSGCYTPAPKITMFPSDMCEYTPVFLGPITVKSMCSHHFLPFTGNVYIEYFPKKQVVGISKLARMVNWFMRRPQIQEEFTKDLCNYISSELPNAGVIVHCTATHMCMTIRGVNQPLGSLMATTQATGIYKRESEAREAFFQEVDRSKQ